MLSQARTHRAQELASFAEFLRPMTDCPRWHRCSDVICPLDRDRDQRSPRIDARASDDVREKRCTLPKAEGMELGAQLPTLGLFPTEFAIARRRARNMIPNVRQKALRTILRKKLAVPGNTAALIDTLTCLL